MTSGLRPGCIIGIFFLPFCDYAKASHWVDSARKMAKQIPEEVAVAIEKKWLTAAETAAYLNLNPKSVYRACKDGRLPFAKVPGIGIRIDKNAIDQLLADAGREAKR
jgi:excisionase family DNA binding protein